MTRSNWGTWALWLLLIGCGEQSIEPVNGGATGGGGSTGGSSGASGVGGGTTGGTGGQAGVDAGAFNPPVWVSAVQWDADWVAVAVGLPQPDPQKRCYSRLVAGCMVTDCRTSKYGPDSAIGADLGAITIGSPAGDVVLTPDANYIYTPVGANGIRWNVGDDVPIHCAGGALPAFSATLKMPGPLTMFSVPASELDAQTPLQLSWLPVDDYVNIQLNQEFADWDYLVAECKFPGQSGKGTIPVQVLQEFELGKQTGVHAYHMAWQELPVGERIVWAHALHAQGWTVHLK
jgi:hypothetical protein